MSGRQLALGWVIAIAISVGLLAIGVLRGPWDAALLLPHPGSVRNVLVFVREAFAERPLEATALIAIPFVMLLVTLGWLVRFVVTWVWGGQLRSSV